MSELELAEKVLEQEKELEELRKWVKDRKYHTVVNCTCGSVFKYAHGDTQRGIEGFKIWQEAHKYCLTMERKKNGTGTNI